MVEAKRVIIKGLVHIEDQRWMDESKNGAQPRIFLAVTGRRELYESRILYNTQN